jgi:hypothetical protein
MARCRARQQNVSRAQRHACESLSICHPSVLQLLHHVSAQHLVLCQNSDAQRLLFMTYNGWVMLAVAVGAFIGYLAFGAGLSATKSVACH